LYSIGQRWVSNGEAELGLGIIKDNTGRRIEVSFPASGEQRTYAADNAPLSRVLYPVGDKVSTNEDVSFIITDRHQINDCFIYQGTDDDGNEISIHEMDLNSFVQFSQPQDRLFAGQIDKNRQFELRVEALAHQHRLQQSPVFGLMGARVQLLPHQIYIAHQVANRHAPRVLLADEVGLGKTIEAGLIIHQQLITGRANRVLIVVSDSLVHQWLVEMLRRFNLQFTIMDAERHHALLEAGENNPFESAQLILCSLSMLSSQTAIYEDARMAPWDLMIVDEAHHLQWSEDAPSGEYQFIEQLAEITDGLILLTATPEQLGKQSHFAQLKLLDKERFHSLPLFLEEQQAFEPVAHLAEKLVNARTLANSDTEALSHLIDKKLHVDFLQALENETLRQEVINQLIDRHGTGRILFRNSRHVVQGFPEREFYAYPLLGNGDDSDAIYLGWLVEQLKKLKDVQVLLICQHATTVLGLQKKLRDKFAVNVATFHEGMSIIERDRAAAYFADQNAQVQVLLCSEIGSEGRNFQFVHHLILLDLPENPDLLQQRIGRLDRIGQKHIIKIHVPYIVGSRQHSLCRWYAEGLRLFQANSNAAHEVYQIQKQQEKHVCEDLEQEELDELVEHTRELMQKVEEKMRQSRDILLELNSCRTELAEQVIGEIRHLSNEQALWQYMEEVFDCFGVDSEYHSKDCAILKMGQAQRVGHFPYVPEDGVTVTVNRDIALLREDMQFMSWEHPMVVSAMDLVLSDNIGNAAISVVRHADLSAGQYLVECLFLIECSAPQNLQLSRFLPATPIRILISQKQLDLTGQILHDDLLDIESNIENEQITAFIGEERKNIYAMLAIAEQSAERKMLDVIAKANSKMLQVSAREIKRLSALAEVNPGIRPEEIEVYKNKAIDSHGYINDAKLRLDAVRFIISS